MTEFTDTPLAAVIVRVAAAIEELSRTCPVLLAAIPGRLVERLESHVSVPRRFVRLAPYVPELGSRVEEDQVS